MTLAGLPLAQLAWLLGGAAAVVTLLYILKLRRRRVTVPFALLWDRVRQETESTSLFRRLKRLLSLLVQLLVLFLVVAALGDPRLGEGLLRGRDIILLVDSSASMQSMDGGSAGGGEPRSRLDQARERARAQVRAMGGADQIMLVSMAGQATPLTPFTADDKELLRALDGLKASDTAADLPRALQFCADALQGRSRPLLVIISDGAFEEGALARVTVGKAGESKGKGKGKGTGVGALDRVDLSGVEVRYQGVGRSGGNIGIVAFNARRYPRNKLSFELFLEVVNHRDTPARADLTLYSDGRLIEVQRLRLEPGKRTRFICDPTDPDGQRAAWCKLAAGGALLEARLTRPGGAAGRLDDFPLDDRAWALLPRRARQKVLLVTRGNLYLEGALLLEDSLEITRVRPDAYTEAAARLAEAVIFDRFFPASPPPTSYLAVAPPDATSPVAVKRRVSSPLITEQDASHPVMRWVTLKDVNISEAAAYTRAPEVRVLAASFREPIIVATLDDTSRRSVVIGFDVTRSDLPMRVAFPLLVMNSLDWFSGESDDLVTSFRVGQRISVAAEHIAPGTRAGEVSIRGPAGLVSAAQVERGRVSFVGHRVGVYRLRLAGGELHIAANLAHAGESNTRPAPSLSLGGARIEPPAVAGPGLVRRQIWPYLLLVVAALLLMEWFTYNRRVTV